MRFLWIGVFGLVGVFSRYGIDTLALKLPTSFPVGTFVINILGSLLLGIIYACGVEKAWIPPDLRVGLMVGLMGGFTTFSSYALQSTRLYEDGAAGQAFLYLFGSPVLGFAAAWAGTWIVRALA